MADVIATEEQMKPNPKPNHDHTTGIITDLS
jgi:hypothetical protein